MPSKANKMAARQAKLRSKKQKRKANVYEKMDPGPTQSKTGGTNDPAEIESTIPDIVNTPHQSKPQTDINVSQNSELNIGYEYLGKELKRIGIFSSIIFAVLILLYFSPVLDLI